MLAILRGPMERASLDLAAALERIRAARTLLAPHLRAHPSVYSYTFSESAGTDVYLKLENLQRTGSFKARGALNKLLRLEPRERERGVIAASAGNHAQAWRWRRSCAHALHDRDAGGDAAREGAAHRGLRRGGDFARRVVGREPRGGARDRARTRARRWCIPSTTRT
jgi:hypothetical protein